MGHAEVAASGARARSAVLQGVRFCKGAVLQACQQAPEEKVQGKTKGVRGSGLHQREKKRAEARSAGRARQEQVQGVWGFGLCSARIARVGHASARTSAVGADARSAGGASICQHPRERSRCKE